MKARPAAFFFVRFFVPVAVLLIAGAVMLGRTEIDRQTTRLMSQESLNVGLGAGALTGQIEGVSRDLAFLASHSALRRAIDAPTAENLASLAGDFASFSRSKGVYDQLRWLDEAGREVVRVDYVDGEPVIVPPEGLQEKGGRYFFADTMKLMPGEIFISPLDLNIERGKIEVPYKPMVRVATPVTDARGKRRGIVILNYYGREMLRAFAVSTKAVADHVSVVNSDGYWLKSPRPEEEWGFMFGRAELSLASRAPAAWQRIRAGSSGQLELDDGLWTWQTVYPLMAGQKSSTGAGEAFVPSRGEIEIHQYVWKAVAHLPAAVFAEASGAVWERVGRIAAVLLAVFGFGCWKLAEAWSAQARAEAVARQANAGLEATVAERTRALHEIIAELDESNNRLFSDITRRKKIESELRIAATAFEGHEGILVTDPRRVILRVNQAFTRITGYEAAEAVGQTPRLLQSGRHSAEFYAEMHDTLARTGRWQGEIWNRRKNGEIYPEWLTITAVHDDAGELANYVAMLTDITARKEAEEEIRQLAFYDPLTKLPNRRLMTDRLSHALTAIARRGRQGALMLLDLDNFKNLNDTLGHAAGDQLLVEVACRLKGCVRETDTVARLGGDEFVVILEDLDRGAAAVMQAEQVAQKILIAVSRPYTVEVTDDADRAQGHDFRQHHCTSSIGIALIDDAEVTTEELLKRADTAMYEAKAAGRDVLRFFDHGMQTIISKRARIEGELRHAIANEQFLVHFQPQVNAEGRVTGAEALVRWAHPERGLVSPAEFIPVAEDTGMILPIGFWVLQQSCLRLAAWAQQPELAHLTLAVNISARQFSLPNWVEEVVSLLDTTGAPADHLELEVTESLLLANTDSVIEKMSELRDHGVRFSLDDFGTGYSSLAYLKSLPLDKLKIDQSFVRDVLDDANDAAIAKTVVALADALSLAVIAEGVETDAQREWLSTVGCHLYQGYLFSPALPPDQFESYARQPLHA